jgi:hypothetical protein
MTLQFAADIVATSFSPSAEEIGRLGTMAVIRRFLNYQIFQRLYEAQVLRRPDAPKHFGEAPVFVHFPASLTLMVALALLAIGLAAVTSMACDAGPFGPP